MAYHLMNAIVALIGPITDLSASALEPCIVMSTWAGDMQTAMDAVLLLPEEEAVGVHIDVWRQQLTVQGVQCKCSIRLPFLHGAAPQLRFANVRI